MTPIKVTCGIIFNDEGKALLCRRKPDKFMGGYWEFPGGKVEKGESLEECLERELLEELAMEVQVKQHLKTVFHDYDDFQIELVSFLCKFQQSTYALTDHDLYEWVSTSELLEKQLALADVPIAECLSSFEYQTGK